MMTFDELLASFKVQPDLNRQFWTKDDTLHPKIRKALLLIAKKFYDDIELENKPKIKDIVFTGSLANYNYSDFSDVDLHLLFDFGEDKELLSQFFLLAKSKWNDKHDVTIKGYDVEVYAEDINSPHVATGLYSVLRNKWIKEPKQETPVVDEDDVYTKVKYFIGLYNELLQQFKQNNLTGLDVKIEKFRDKLGKFRQSGLQKGGEFSTENVAFKVLRRAGYMDKVADLQNAVIDKQLSVKEVNNE
jgi:predicted nucleotidyltransferase